MKRLIALLLALLIVMPCAMAEEDPNAALVDIAREVAPRLSGLCAIEGYPELFTTNEDILDLVRQWGGDWPAETPPVRAGAAFVPQSATDALLGILAGQGLIAPELAYYGDFLLTRIATVPASTLNAQQGTNWVAASAMAGYSEVRAMDVPENGCAWVLLDYGSEHPMVLVSFCLRAEGTASINAAFVDPGAIAEPVFAVLSGAVDLKSMLTGLALGALSAENEAAETLNALLPLLDELRLSAY
ncbi:MAG: hypothetical protein Q4C10_11680 [Clostridia bacterium]|nr:hypothetical protein [Clostridia bacterium]